MSTIDGVESDKVFLPNTRTIAASMAGSFLVLFIAAGLAGAALLVFFLGTHDYGDQRIDLAFLAFTILVAAAIAYSPLRKVRYRMALSKATNQGKYRITVTPDSIIVETGPKRFPLDFKDFAVVCRDSEFLGNNRDWGGLVLSKTNHDKLSWKQRASVVKAIRKGRVEPVTHDGITTIPLVYFARGKALEIFATACENHERTRNQA